MRSTLRGGLALTLTLTLGACAERAQHTTDHLPLAGGWDGNRGGWDGNRGGWDGNAGGWDGNAGGWDGNAGGWDGNAAAWAPEGTGPGTLSNPTLIGLGFLEEPDGSTPCAMLTPGVTRIAVRSSRSPSAGAWIGPDVEVVPATGAPRWLDADETVVVRGRAYNGYLHYVDATFRVTRLATYHHPRHPDVAWPAFHVEACKDGDAAGGFRSLGVVSFMPFFTLPEAAGEPVVFHDDLVQPISVPYSTQPAALAFKFAAGAGLPIAVDGEPALDPIGCTSGARVPNRELLLAGALALGNASWVTLPGDDHRFVAFFTKTGNPVALFAQIAAAGAERVCLAAGAARVPLEHLDLTEIELAAINAGTLDAVATGNTYDDLPVTDREAGGPTHLASGRSTFRRDTYLETSLHPLREELVDQLVDNIATTRLGLSVGAVESQALLRSLLPGRVSFVVAAQSPVPVDVGFDPPPSPGVCGNAWCEPDETCDSCAEDCAVCDHPPPWECDGSGCDTIEEIEPIDEIDGSGSGTAWEPPPDADTGGAGDGSGTAWEPAPDADTGAGDGSGTAWEPAPDADTGGGGGSGSGTGSGWM